MTDLLPDSASGFVFASDFDFPSPVAAAGAA
jgi:hypothetical protein